MTEELLKKLHTAMCNDNEHQCNRLNNYIHTDEYLTAEVVQVVKEIVAEETEELTLKISSLESDCDAYNYSQRTYQEEIKELKAQIEKTKWHDLRIDPNDLPKKNKSYWVYIDCQGNKIYRSIVWQGCWLGWNCIPLAWCEEPQFKE